MLVWRNDLEHSESECVAMLQIANSSVLTASQQFCKISLSLFFQQVDRGTGKIAIGTQQPGQDTFTSSALRNDDQVRDAWTSYLSKHTTQGNQPTIPEADISSCH